MPWPTQILTFPQLDSTNQYAKTLPQEAIGTAVLALEQTHGYGSRGRSWIASPGETLTFSLILPWASQASFFPLAVGVACAMVLRARKVPVQLKWPNDLVLGSGKLGGILVEAVFGERAVAGIGLNLCRPSRAGAPDGVGLEVYGTFEPHELIHAIAQELEPRWERLQSGETDGIRAEWEALACTLGQDVLVQTEQGNLLGRARALDPLGGLLLETALGETVVYAGTVRRPDGGYV